MGSTPGTEAHPHGGLENPDVAHEHSDISINGVVWFVAILVLVAGLVHVGMWALMRVLDRMEVSNDPYVSPLAVPVGQLPPEPRLQTTPWQDLKQFRTQEEQYLHSYGWVDQKGGIAHVPIDKAKALLLQRGLAVRQAAGDALEGTHVAASGESSSGRTIPAGGADKSSVPPPAPTAPGAAPQPPKTPVKGGAQKTDTAAQKRSGGKAKGQGT